MTDQEQPQIPLPTIESTLDPSALVARLKQRSKRGKLAGFNEHPKSGLASVTAYGNPFDGILTVEHDATDQSKYTFTVGLDKKMPVILAAILMVTVWPGLPLTDSFLHNFIWYEKVVAWGLQTWMWYVPTSILPSPFIWRTAIRRSRATTHSHAIETIEKIRPLFEPANPSDQSP